MIKNKKTIILVAIIFIVAVLIIRTGFKERTDVVLDGYSVAEDKTSLNLEVLVINSMGYARDTKIKDDGTKKYITFYSTFGGMNSKLGAKREFQVELTPDCEEIYFYHGGGGYTLVLEKNSETGQWEKSRLIGRVDTKTGRYIEIERGRSEKILLPLFCAKENTKTA